MKDEVKRLLVSIGRPLLPMADDYFARGELLKERGWCAFQPPLDGLYDFGTEEEVAEYKYFLLDRAKGAIGMHAYQSGYFSDLQRKAYEAYAQSRDYVDRSFPALRRLVRLLMRENKVLYEKKLARIRTAIETARQEEMGRHCKGYYKEVDASRFKDRLVLYKRVMESELSRLGFSWDKTLSTRSKPIYTKPLFDVWKVGFTLEWQNFINAYLAENNPTGGSLEMYFGLVHESNKGFVLGDYTKAIVFKFSNFFPTAVYCLISGDVYKDFRNNQELESIILAHIDMYTIIQEQFEGLVLEGLKKQ